MKHFYPRPHTLIGTAATGVACATFAALVFSAQDASAIAVPASDDRKVGVIIEGSEPGSMPAVRAAVKRAGGRVDTRLGIINGVRATVPAASVDSLRAAPGVLDVNPDSKLLPMDEKWADDTSGESAKASVSGSWKADNDLGSAFTIEKNTGAQVVWGKNNPNNSTQKLTGKGVGVALIDTGVSPVEGLLTTGKIVNGPDLSFESQSANTRYLDGFGHGTHMAGLIAGKASAVTAGNEADNKYFVGMAPDATIVNVKVGTGDGGVDASQVIAGIDWVVTNRAKNNTRVINLSYGTDSTQAYTLDPLAHAVESAWRKGIVVVVAAGNDGESGPKALTMPAIDPFVIAVGSVDHKGIGTAAALRVGAWTNSGTTTRRPDLIAPGKSVVSLRVPNSFADKGFPTGVVPKNTLMFRGTGTSQSAAVVSGAAALLLQRNPSLTPDQVKGVLKETAVKLEADTSLIQGAGQINVRKAVERLESGTALPSYTQTMTKSTGLGTLNGARGGSYVADPINNSMLTGEIDPFGVAWNPATWAPKSTAGTAWTGGTWNGSVWAGTTWNGTTLAPVAWTSRSWSQVLWSSRSWSSMTFLSRSWSGSDWVSRSWSSDRWSSRSWSSDDAW